MSEKEKINEVKFENIDNNKINKTNIKENENLQKEKNQEQNFLSFKSKIETNENDDNNFKTFDFNINPFNEKKTKEFADEESNKNSDEDEEFILAEDDIKNNFNLENFNYTNYLNIENNNQSDCTQKNTSFDSISIIDFPKKHTGPKVLRFNNEVSIIYQQHVYHLLLLRIYHLFLQLLQ